MICKLYFNKAIFRKRCKDLKLPADTGIRGSLPPLSVCMSGTVLSQVMLEWNRPAVGKPSDIAHLISPGFTFFM